MLQPLHEIHKHAHDALELPVNEVEGDDGILTERAKDNHLVRFLADGSDCLICRFKFANCT